MRIFLLFSLSFLLLGCSGIGAPAPWREKSPIVPNPLPVSSTGSVVSTGAIVEPGDGSGTIVEQSGTLTPSSGSGEDTDLENADTILNPVEKE